MEERELQRIATAWVTGGAVATMGTAVLTEQRVLFFDQRFAENAGIGGVVGVGLDRLALATSGGEILFNDGWKPFAPTLRDAIASSGRTVVDDGPDAWHVVIPPTS